MLLLTFENNITSGILQSLHFIEAVNVLKIRLRGPTEMTGPVHVQ